MHLIFLPFADDIRNPEVTKGFLAYARAEQRLLHNSSKQPHFAPSL